MAPCKLSCYYYYYYYYYDYYSTHSSSRSIPLNNLVDLKLILSNDVMLVHQFLLLLLQNVLRFQSSFVTLLNLLRTTSTQCSRALLQRWEWLYRPRAYTCQDESAQKYSKLKLTTRVSYTMTPRCMATILPELQLIFPVTNFLSKNNAQVLAER